MYINQNLRHAFLAAVLIVSVCKTTLGATTFNLWAYGSSHGIGAAGFCQGNGIIFLCNGTSAGHLTPIYFSNTDDDTNESWTVHSNATNKPVSTLGKIALPNSNSSNTVAIVTESNSTYGVRDFFLYDSTVLAKNGGQWENHFYALATNISGIWKLVWDPENLDNHNSQPVVLRNLSPEH
ncbi:uncharacterized protein G6M90_00g066700 [Metarhizium brunneum]|uniref:Uncharacterized protein n=1 Tax=Metarhizium brunneum TaxID=500148 RepID=A0A7D5UXD3_9HYPO|nr:hypothetical protein G6M90_00g066700 [Metarhizium brunneum]